MIYWDEEDLDTWNRIEVVRLNLNNVWDELAIKLQRKGMWRFLYEKFIRIVLYSKMRESYEIESNHFGK